MKTVAIVGGGISGLAAAEAVQRHANEAGVEVETIVLEADSIVGGKITTRHEAGFVIETGPHGFLDKEPTAMALIERLGLNDQMIRADVASAKRYIFRGGRLRLLPMKPPAFLTSDILPFFGKLRVGLEPFIPKKTSAEEESVWQFAARRIGKPAANILVDAMVTGIYGGDPKRLSVSAAFPRLVEIEQNYGGLIRGQLAIAKEKRLAAQSGQGEQQGFGGPSGALHSFRRGLGTWIDALAARTRVETNHPVRGLERTPEGRYRLLGGPAPLEADAVILTVPTFEMADLLRPHRSETAEALGAVPYAPVAVVVQGFEASALGRSLEGFGFLVPGQEERKILGAIWASTVFAGHAPDGMVMLRTLLGGARHPELAEGDDETLGERARLELVATMGIRAEARPVHQSVVRWPRGIPQYELGHLARVRAADELEAAMPGLFLSGNGLRGVAMIQCVKEAERTGPLVARHLAAGL